MLDKCAKYVYLRNKPHKHFKYNMFDNSQLPIPFAAVVQDSKNYVKQHWNVTFSVQRRISVTAKKILTRVLAQIQENDNKLKPFYIVHVNDVAKALSDPYRAVKAAFKELVEAAWYIADLEGEEVIPRHLLDTTRNLDIDGFITRYKNGYLQLVLNPQMENYFVKLAHWSTYEIEGYDDCETWYSMRLFELLSDFKDSGFWRPPITELKILMDCATKYPNAHDFFRRVIDPAQKDLEKTNMAFTYDPQSDDKVISRGRRQVV